MENQSNQYYPGQSGSFNNTPVPQNLPNANLILVLGILSILFCWWHFVSIAGIALGLLALVLAHRETNRYQAYPDTYTISSLNNVRTGRTCALIGLTISIIVFAFVMLLIFGVIVTLPFWGMIQSP
ncbi:MAG: CCC motif membrane protein [Bacteroidetes bacterium]|nr:CCC motif membrane protein [Bacteroidota bacterium]